jgi:hypothetical protein
VLNVVQSPARIIIRESSVTIGTSVVEISPETGTRQRNTLVLTNTSTASQKISLAWNSEAVAGKGIVLLAGEHHVESIDTGFIPLNSRITGIADGAGGTLAIHERLQDEVV